MLRSRSARLGVVLFGAVLVWMVGCAPSRTLRVDGSPVVQVRLAPPLSPNAFLILGARGPVVVDPGPAGESHADRLDAALAAHGYGPEEVSLVVLTHGHADHAGGAARLQALGVPVVAGAGDISALRAGQSDTLHAIGPEAALVETFLVGDGAFPPVEPDLVLGPEAGRASLDLETYGVAGRVVTLPGHTPGSLGVLLASGEAVAGDLVRGGYFGGLVASRRPVTHYFQDDRHRAAGNVEALLHWGARRLYVGHGGPLESSQLRAWTNR